MKQTNKQHLDWKRINIRLPYQPDEWKYVEYLTYEKFETSKKYRCYKCGATKCKLWRETALFNPIVLCAYCAAKSQKEDISSIDSRGFHLAKDDDGLDYQTDTIGYYHPAIPVPACDAYWAGRRTNSLAYSWWKTLPTKPKMKRK